MVLRKESQRSGLHSAGTNYSTICRFCQNHQNGPISHNPCSKALKIFFAHKCVRLLQFLYYHNLDSSQLGWFDKIKLGF